MAFMAMFSGCWDLFAQTERLEIRRADEAGKRELSWLPNVPRSTESTPLSARYQSEDLSWLGLIEAHEALWKGGPFGSMERFTDFSQFTVSGHYTNSVTMAAYFRAMTWLGRIDSRMGGGDSGPGSLPQLSGAVSSASY